MDYNRYITKKRARIRGLFADDFNIPANTICDVYKTVIMYKDKPVCFVTSQNCKDFFYGLSDENTEQELERQKLADKLRKMAPDFSVEQSKHYIRAWEEKGWAEQLGNGAIQWFWKDEVMDSSLETLQNLIQCIKDNKAPFTLKVYKDEDD